MTTPLQFLAGAKALQGEGASLPVQLSGSTLAEQKTQDDLVEGIVTFSEALSGLLEVINRDEDNDGVFTINGTDVTVPNAPAGGFTSTGRIQVAGTASAEVTVSGSTAFLINRYE